MNDIFLFLMVLMGTLAVLDLIVGVSNDAVNFIGSAVGSRAASFKFIIVVASVGIILGAVFSNGMMEIARRGIFHPEMFVFEEVIMIYLAVMITDVILLDVFNTLGLPTSTTVSMVFELLGASVAMSVFKVVGAEDVPSFLTFMGDLPTLGDYINYEKTIPMITGIFAVVIIAFVAGVVIQWLVRFMLTFNYSQRLKYWGGLIGGVALTAIVFYLLLKGGKRHDHHSSGGQGMDRNAFDAVDADMLCFFHPRFAAAGVGVQDQYLEGDRAFRNLRPGDGLCGQ